MAKEAVEKSSLARKPDANRLMLDRFHIDMDHGAVWLDNRRVLVLQAEWLLDLRRDLVGRLGTEEARSILTRIGYAAGVRDAETSRKLHPGHSPRQLVSTGGDFHALQGSARARAISVELDMDANYFRSVFAWRNTIEDQDTIVSENPQAGGNCWMEIGYASGFLTTCLGQRVFVKEIDCASEGHDECLCIATYLHQEGSDDPTVRFLFPDVWPQKVSLNRTKSAGHDYAGHTADGNTPVGVSGTGLVGRSAAFARVIESAKRVSNTIATVLLLGESGVGKSALAKYIHDQSDRSSGPFVEVNCAAIPETLLESELFGVEKGAFTSAANSRPGRFEEADTGTLFLDEIGLLTPAAQGKLLRVLQSQKFERLGSNKTRISNIRLIAATNNDLHASVRDGSFRADLFYRLNVFPIQVPPLRSRISDIPPLIEYLVTKICKRYNRPQLEIAPETYRAMLRHEWPGNIRELENVLERAVILTEPGEQIGLHHLFTSHAKFLSGGLHWIDEQGRLTESNASSQYEASWITEALEQPNHSLEEIEQAVVISALRACGGNVMKASKYLSISRAQIDYRIKKWGLNPAMYC